MATLAVEFLEDLTVGDTHDLGGFRLTRDEIVRFAERYDPQPFHVDEEAAQASPFGGLVASGWHTACRTMRSIMDTFAGELRSRGARGVDDLRWVRPVRPGDELRVSGEVLGTSVPAEDAARGDVRYRVTVRNREDEVVMTLMSLFMVDRRDAP